MVAGNANLLIGALQDANQEIGVPSLATWLCLFQLLKNKNGPDPRRWPVFISNNSLRELNSCWEPDRLKKRLRSGAFHLGRGAGLQAQFAANAGKPGTRPFPPANPAGNRP